MERDDVVAVNTTELAGTPSTVKSVACTVFESQTSPNVTAKSVGGAPTIWPFAGTLPSTSIRIRRNAPNALSRPPVTHLFVNDGGRPHR